MTVTTGEKLYLDLLGKMDRDIKCYESETSRNAIAYATAKKEEDRVNFLVYKAKLEVAVKMKYYLTSVGGLLRSFEMPGETK